MRKRLLFAAGVLLAFSSVASPLPCHSFGGSGSCHYDVTLQGPIPIPGSVALMIPGFDPALGTLTEASIATTVALRGFAILTNIASEPWDIMELIRSVSALGGPGWMNIAQDSFFDLIALGVPPGESVRIDFAQIDGSPFPALSGPEMAALTRAGMTPATFQNSPFEEVSASGMPIELTGWVERVDIDVNYFYVDGISPPIPEPGTAALMAIGLAALLRRNRRA